MLTVIKNSLSNYFLVYVLFFCLIAVPSSTADAAQSLGNAQAAPLKVAVMPTTSRVKGHDDVIAKLDKDISRQMHLSLNDTLQLADYLESYKVLYAMEDSGFTNQPNIDTLKQTADLLNVDVIVGYTVPIMYQHYFHSYLRRGEGPLMRSYITVKLWAYYRPLDKVIALSDSRQYFDEISTMGALTELANDASYNLSKKAALNNLLKQAVQIKKGDA